MNFRTAIIFLMFFFCSSHLFSQGNDFLRKWQGKAETYGVKFDTNWVHLYRKNPPKYYLAQIQLRNQHDLADIARLGIETEHLNHSYHAPIIELFINEDEKKLILRNGFHIIKLKDTAQLFKTHDAQRLDLPVSICGVENPPLKIPRGFRLGTQGGHFTYLEILEHLDSLHMRFPNLISKRFVLDSTLKTHEGNYLYGVKVTSADPFPIENKPEVLFTGVHHAREPLSVSNLIFFLYFIGENYHSDPKIRRIVDDAVMYFVPCINPDGYIYNELTQPDGGGMWRKNLRKINGVIRGVDLNRNYSYDWGKDNFGSAADPFSETYRGDAPFSEPETQTIRNFCRQRKFRIALNYHAFANALLTPTRELIHDHDSAYFNFISKVITLENGYTWGSFAHALGYYANGTSDDYMYRGLGENKIFAFTPEIGSGADYFWPRRDRIIPLCTENVNANINAVLLLLEYNLTAVEEGVIVPIKSDHSVVLNLKVLPLGLSQNADSVEVRLFPLKNIAGGEQKFRLPYKGKNQLIEHKVTLRLIPGFKHGEEIAYELSSGLIKTNWRHHCGVADTLIFDPFDDLKNWRSSSGRWQITDREYVSPPSCLADAPNGNYPASPVPVRTFLRSPIGLSGNILVAEMRFHAKWDYAPAFDLAQVLLSDGDGNEQVLCGRFSDKGTRNFAAGQPVYSQRQNEWVHESIDLTPFKEQNINIQMMTMGTARMGNGRGFRMDDFLVHVLRDTANTGEKKYIKTLKFPVVFPNPTNDEWVVDCLPESEFLGEKEDYFIVELFNALGQNMQVQAFRSGSEVHKIRIKASHLPSGVYQLKLNKNDTFLRVVKW